MCDVLLSVIIQVTLGQCTRPSCREERTSQLRCPSKLCKVRHHFDDDDDDDDDNNSNDDDGSSDKRRQRWRRRIVEL